MQIIDYFRSENQAHLLELGEFHSFVGKGTLYLLTDGEQLVSFATLAERDCIDVDCGPWIGFIHTAPAYRGHRYAGKLIDRACTIAATHGLTQVYICTDHVGLYEKYGFAYLESRVDQFGEESRVYVRDPRSVKGCLTT